MSKRINKHKSVLAWLWIVSLVPIIAAQSGGNFTISQSVIASGGQSSANANLAVDGSAGQAAAGTSSTGGNYAVRGGFWASNSLAPTAANVALSGRVTNERGGIISRVQIFLTDASTGVMRSAQTNSFGFYKFEELEVGHFYVVRPASKKFALLPESYTFVLLDNLENIDFTVNAL